MMKKLINNKLSVNYNKQTDNWQWASVKFFQKVPLPHLYRLKYCSHTPLVAMPSWLPPCDLYCHKQQKQSIGWPASKKLEIYRWEGGKRGWYWRTQQRMLPTAGHMTYSQAPPVYGKNICHLFHFTQPVENNMYLKLQFLTQTTDLRLMTTCLSPGFQGQFTFVRNNVIIHQANSTTYQ